VKVCSFIGTSLTAGHIWWRQRCRGCYVQPRSNSSVRSRNRSGVCSWRQKKYV